MPTWDTRVIDLKKASESQAYCDDFSGVLAGHGLVVTELASHLRGQLVALHPAFDVPADSFAAPEVRGNPDARQKWAVQQLLYAARASRRLGLDRHVTFSGHCYGPICIRIRCGRMG